MLLLERELVDGVALSSLGFNQKRFKKFDPTRPRGLGYQGYIDDKAGLALKAFNNGVFQIDFFPIPADRKLCPGFYLNPKDFVETYVLHAPRVDIKCPKEVIAGEVVRLKADYIRGLVIGLTWHVPAATILEGQGRRRLAFDTTGLGGKTILVEIERLDSNGFASSDSCKVVVKHPENVLTWQCVIPVYKRPAPNQCSSFLKRARNWTVVWNAFHKTTLRDCCTAT